MRMNVSYLDDLDIYYLHCLGDEDEFMSVRDKCYKITCILKISDDLTHKNIYLVPQPRLGDFVRCNQERLMDIEAIDFKEVVGYIGK